MFATYGLPQQLVSDNGPQFVAAEFTQFLKENGVKHVRCSPYHPSSNGLAERFVQSFKQAIKAGERRGTPVQQSLAEFLLTYRVTPHATTNASPSQLFMGRQIRTRLDLLHPNGRATVRDRQAKQKQHHDIHSRDRVFHEGQHVFVRNFREGPKWKQGVIVERCGPLTYLVQADGSESVWKRHVDHLKTSFEDLSGDTAVQTTDEFSSPSDYLPTWEDVSNTSPPRETAPQEGGNETRLSETATQPEVKEGLPALCRSNRVKRPPIRWE